MIIIADFNIPSLALFLSFKTLLSLHDKATLSTKGAIAIELINVFTSILL